MQNDENNDGEAVSPLNEGRFENFTTVKNC